MLTELLTKSFVKTYTNRTEHHNKNKKICNTCITLWEGRNPGVTLNITGKEFGKYMQYKGIDMYNILYTCIIYIIYIILHNIIHTT